MESAFFAFLLIASFTGFTAGWTAAKSRHKNNQKKGASRTCEHPPVPICF